MVADALGYHTKHVAKVWTEAGGDWKPTRPGDQMVTKPAGHRRNTDYSIIEAW